MNSLTHIWKRKEKNNFARQLDFARYVRTRVRNNSGDFCCCSEDADWLMLNVSRVQTAAQTPGYKYVRKIKTCLAKTQCLSLDLGPPLHIFRSCPWPRLVPFSFYQVWELNQVSTMSERPEIPAGYLGSQPKFAELRLQALTHDNPEFSVDQNSELEIKFKAPKPVKVSCRRSRWVVVYLCQCIVWEPRVLSGWHVCQLVQG